MGKYFRFSIKVILDWPVFLFSSAIKIHGQVFKIKCSKTFSLDNHIVPFATPYGELLRR